MQRRIDINNIHWASLNGILIHVEITANKQQFRTHCHAHQIGLDVFIIGDDSVVYHNEFCARYNKKNVKLTPPLQHVINIINSSDTQLQYI